MIRLACLLTAATLLLPAAPADADRDAVHAAVTDYVEALYQAAPERLEGSVSPDLVKRGYWRNEGEAEYMDMGLMSFEQLSGLAAGWNKDGQQGSDLTYEIEIHEVMDITASAKLSAKWGIDYMHLRKVEGEWEIIHILWQAHPPEQADGE